MKIALIPFYKTQERNIIFKKELYRDDSGEIWEELKRDFELKGMELNTNDLYSESEIDKYIFLRLDFKLLFKLWYQNKLKNCIYIQFEPPVVMKIHEEKNLKSFLKVFSKVLTWNDSMLYLENMIKFYPPMPKRKKQPNIIFKNKKFLCNISGNKKSNHKNELYSKRIEAIRYFERQCLEEFSLYGVGWSKKDFPSYKGTVKEKNSILSKYKFTLCYENMKEIKGLLSEKIFDCFYAKTIPIFWGASNIQDYIPEECYIDKRKFKTYDELYLYLCSITEEEYNYRIKKIEEYLLSENFKKFLSENFSKVVINSLKENNKIIAQKKIKQIVNLINIYIKFIYYKLITKLKKG